MEVAALGLSGRQHDGAQELGTPRSWGRPADLGQGARAAAAALPETLPQAEGRTTCSPFPAASLPLPPAEQVEAATLDSSWERPLKSQSDRAPVLQSRVGRGGVERGPGASSRPPFAWTSANNMLRGAEPTASCLSVRPVLLPGFATGPSGGQRTRCLLD